ncbi:solute carrier family 13 member 1 [Betta splendens]|uniref:Solute carrier family 13 member 1 n=1 Tax=Betta splendens TaxID=158456 RepID=A0A6P7MR48_BETSP|nr:solute carrier family 13 member 1 [Betta splendens]
MLKKLSKGLWNYHTVGLVIFIPLLLLPLPLVIGTLEAKCAFVLLLMAMYWVTEVIPLSMTAMLPAILFPMFGIMKSSSVAKEYFKDFHILLVGIICLATSIEKWGLHRRIALRLVTMVGVNPAWLILGFMSGCAFLSMWVQNTSAVAMVMPIVEAVLQQILKAKEEYSGEDNPNLQLDEDDCHAEKNKEAMSNEKNPDGPEESYTCVQIQTVSQPVQSAGCMPAAPSRCKRDLMMCKAMCIGIAYSSSIGGITTLPGTSPNLIFSEYLHQMYPNCDSINFGNWLLLCLPISIIMLLLTWIWLYWLFIGSDFSFLCRRGGEHTEKEKAAKKVLDEEYKSLGPMSSQEIFTAVVFVVMVLLWLTRAPGFVPGWASLFPQPSGYITDATVALLLGFLFFMVPAYGPSRKYEAMISWTDFQASMPWKVALLVGGGFALAEGTKESGLSLWVAELLTPLGELPVLATISIACIIVTTVTEVASNAATITIFLPILSPLAEAIHVNPLFVLIPTTLCTSFSFLLPVSNPPNAVVFSYGHITIMDMVKAGLGVNLIGVLAVLLAVATWGVPLFSLDAYPHWAPVLPVFNSTAP